MVRVLRLSLGLVIRLPAAEVAHDNRRSPRFCSRAQRDSKTRVRLDAFVHLVFSQLVLLREDFWPKVLEELLVLDAHPHERVYDVRDLFRLELVDLGEYQNR